MANIPDDPSVCQPILQQLKKNFSTHQTKQLSFRREQLESLIRGHQELKAEFDEALQKDLGYSQFMSFFLSHTITHNEMKHCLDHFEKWSKPTSVDLPIMIGVGKAYVQPEPLGVALVLSAWNYPVYVALPFVALSIAAGNCVILKPSQIAPYTSHVLQKLFDKYLDNRFYRCIQGKSSIANTLVSSKVDLILFTGSSTVGTIVAQCAAKNLVPCILQLGGKCPVIVDSSAKISGAAKRIVMGRFMNCGQTCVASDHVFVHNSVKGQFVRELLEKVKEAYGVDVKSNGDMGKIISQNHVKRLEGYLTENHGGKVLWGGKVHPDTSFIEPTIVDQPREDSQMMKDQIFGPILPIFGYDNLQDVITKINSRPKPLAIYLFTEDSKIKEKIHYETSAGSLVVNDVAVQLMNNEWPFGGVGMSGYGRYHGKCGFESCSNMKSVLDVKIMDSYPMNQRFPPYTESKQKTLTFLINKIGALSPPTIIRTIALIVLVVVAVTQINKYLKGSNPIEF